MTVFHFVLKRSIANKTSLLILFLFPVVAIFLPSGEYWPHLPYGYQYFGIFILFISLKLSGLILEDRMRGIAKKVSIAPISHFSYLAQNLLAYFSILILQCLILVFGGVLVGKELYQPFWLFILFITFSMASIAFALMWISFFRNKEISMLIFMSIISVIALIGGVLIPIELLPEILQKIAIMLPTFWLAWGIDWVVFGGELKEFLLVNGMLILYMFLFLITGSVKKLH
ncbi:ABC transporter permease [Cytobacillus sp. FSL R7-0696]|uniref:ABC transporter permease n=1 Tax=Cytobacillus sp. FSL R7-0696 TaxID=2921691 RepID=UPI0030F82BFD